MAVLVAMVAAGLAVGSSSDARTRAAVVLGGRIDTRWIFIYYISFARASNESNLGRIKPRKNLNNLARSNACATREGSNVASFDLLKT